MPGIKAGTAYVSVELTGVDRLRRDMTDRIADAAGTAGSRASRRLREEMNGSDIGDETGGRIRTSLLSRLRGIGSVSANDILTSMRNGLSGLPGLVGSIFSGALGGVRAFTSAIGSAIAAVPGLLITAGKHLEDFSKKVGMLAYQFQFAGAMMTLAFTAPVVGVGILGAAIGVKFAVQVEDAMIALKALLPAGYDVAALIKRLQQLAIQSPVFDSASVITFTQRMVSAGMEVGKTERFLKAFGNIAVTSGTSMDKMTRALEAFAQMAGKGKVQMEELRQQLGDALPSAMKIAADGLGVTQEKLFSMVSAGEVTADQLMDAFIRVGEGETYMNGAAAGADSLRSKWNQMKETVQTQLGSAVLANMDKIKTAFDDIQPVLNKFIGWSVSKIPTAIGWLGKLADKLQDLKNWYEDLTPKQEKFVKILALVAVVAGPVALVLGAVGTVVAAIAAAMSALLSPVGLVIVGILAVAAAGYGLYKWFVNLYNSSEALRETIKKIVSGFVDELLPTIKKFADNVKEGAVKAWEQLKSSMQGIDWSGLLYLLKTIAIVVGVVLAAIVGMAIGVLAAVLNAIGPIIQAIVSFFTGLVKIVAGVSNFLHDLFTGNFSKLAGDILLIWNGLWDLVVGTVYNLLRAVWNFVSGFVEAVVGFFKWLYDVLVGHSIIPDMVNAIVEWFQKIPAIIIGLVSGFVSWVAGKFSELASTVIGYVSGLVSGAVSRFNELRSSFQNIISGVVDAAGSMLSYVAGLPGKILNAIGNLGSLLYGKGRDAIQGLLNGISSMAGAVEDKARSIADGVKNAINSALKIGSPSRVMMQIGRFVVSGLVLGMQRDINDVAAVAGRMASAIAQPIAVSGIGAVVDVNGTEARKSASLYIENYTAPKDDDPNKVAESWAWINRTRGWST